MKDFDTTISRYEIRWTRSRHGKFEVLVHTEGGIDRAVFYARNLLKSKENSNIRIEQVRYVENWWED